MPRATWSGIGPGSPSWRSPWPATSPCWPRPSPSWGRRWAWSITAEDQLRTWESEWDRFNQQAGVPAQQAQLERARMTHLEQGLVRDRERQRRIGEELGRLDLGATDAGIADLAERESGLAEEVAEIEDRQAALAEELAAREADQRALAAELDRLRTGLQQAKGRRASLTALQEAALADGDGERTAWLADRGLGQAPRLAERLEVEPGWETAVETALGDALRAVPVPDLAPLTAGGLKPGLVLIDTAVPHRDPPADAGSDCLSDRVRSPWPLSALLGRMRTALDLDDALARRSGLGLGECLIVPDGTRVGTNWLATPAAESTDGVLTRADALKTLEQRDRDPRLPRAGARRA